MKRPSAWPSGQRRNDSLVTDIPDCQDKRTKKTDQMTFKRLPWYAEQVKEPFAANAAGVTRRVRCPFFDPPTHRRVLDPPNDF